MIPLSFNTRFMLDYHNIGDGGGMYMCKYNYSPYTNTFSAYDEIWGRRFNNGDKHLTWSAITSRKLLNNFYIKNGKR